MSTVIIKEPNYCLTLNREELDYIYVYTLSELCDTVQGAAGVFGIEVISSGGRCTQLLYLIMIH